MYDVQSKLAIQCARDVNLKNSAQKVISLNLYSKDEIIIMCYSQNMFVIYSFYLK